MKNVLAYFIKNPLVGNVLVLLILLLGAWGLRSMKSTLFPAAPERFIKITAILPGASPEEMEEGVVLKIEESLQGRTGLERVTSVSSENTATVDVEIKKGYDIEIILQEVKNVVGQISSFPVGMEPLQVFKVENQAFAFSFALTADLPLVKLKQYARSAEDELRATGIMSKITISGFPKEEIEIAFREQDLIKYQLSFAEAANAVRSANIELTGGKIKSSEEELLIRAKNKGYFAEDLNNIAIKTSAEGSVIYLYQIADIRDQWEDVPARSFFNNKPSVVLTINNTDAEDVLTITDYMNKYVEEYNQKSSSSGVKAYTIRDGSINLRQRIDLLVENGVVGFFLVLGCLSLFLNWRIAFWVASSIPIAFAGLFMIGATTELTINVISLFGMIVVVGILVDDGIVISENIYSYHEKGYSKYEAALYGTIDVVGSVFSSVATTVVAFSAFFFLDGRIGDIFFDLALVVVITLIVSLVEGMFILPGHLYHSKALDKEANNSAFLRFMERVFNFMRDYLYTPLLKFSLNSYQMIVPLCVGAALLISSFFLVQSGQVKTTFFPFIERDDIEVSVNMTAGTTENITLEWLSHIEKSAIYISDSLQKTRPDGLAVVEKIEKTISNNAYQGKLKITLLDGERRRMSVLTIGDLIRQHAGEIPNTESVTFAAPSPFGKPVSVSVLGNDINQLTAAVEQLKAKIKDIKGLADVVDNNQSGLREVILTPTDKMMQLGLNLQEITAQVRQGFFGNEVQRLQRGRDEVKIWVRYQRESRDNVGQLENMRIRFADGREFPLHELAKVEIKRGLIAINHISGRREVKVEADLSDGKVSVLDITGKITNEIIPSLQPQFPNVSFLIEGQNKENLKTLKSMSVVLPITGLLMFVIILLTFGSLSQAIAVIMMVPFGFIGVAFGHWWLGTPISFFSFLGIVALVGVMVNDSIVLTEAMNGFIKEGKTFDEAVYEAGRSRFRAILLTSLTTILGLAPLILETSFQAQFLIPMAISIAFGLLVATFVTLLLLPSTLLLINRYRRLIHYSYYGEWVEPTLVEPAYEERKGLFWLWAFPLVAWLVYAYVPSLLEISLKWLGFA